MVAKNEKIPYNEGVKEGLYGPIIRVSVLCR